MCIWSVIQGSICHVQDLIPKAIPSYKCHKNSSDSQVLKIYPYVHIMIIRIEYANKHVQNICIAEGVISVQNEGGLSQNTHSHPAVRTSSQKRFRG
jgi:hypothetical protein